MPFTPAPRTTEADMNNDRKSMDRRLQDSLFLIVKRSRNDHQWQFPQGKWVENETMRAVRSHTSVCNKYLIS
jgi:large subunit ribosomal protein L46